MCPRTRLGSQAECAGSAKWVRRGGEEEREGGEGTKRGVLEQVEELFLQVVGEVIKALGILAHQAEQAQRRLLAALLLA